MSMDQTINELRSRVAKLERENTGSQANTMQDLIVEKILELLAENSEDYIPKLAVLQADIRTLKKNMDSELKLMKQQVSTGVSSNNEDISRIEMDSLRRTLTQTDHALTDKINQVAKDVDDAFTKIYYTMANNPLIGRMDNVESRLPTYANNDRVNSLQEALLDCASNSMVENLITRVNNLDKFFLTRIDYDLYTEQLIKDIDEKLAEKLGQTALNAELDNYDADVQGRIDKVQKSIDSNKKLVKKLQVDFMEVVEVTNNQTELLKTKVDFEEIEKLWKNFEKYSMYEDLKDLYMKTVPEIYKFEQKIEEHRRDIEKQAEVLRRFDEVISDKASKGNLREVVTDVAKTYAEKEEFQKAKQALNDKVYESQKKIQLLQDTIDILGKTITKDIFSAVKKATGHLSGKAAFISSGGGGNAGVSEELKSLVNQKADKQQLVDLSIQKANKIDTELAMRWIEIINRQLKQIIVLVTEMLRFEVHKKDMKVFEGEQHIQHNKGFLFQQALLVSQWVNKFHTQSVNEYFLESSNGVTELNWTPPEVLAFQKYAEEKLEEVDLEVLATRNATLALNMKMRSKTVAQGGSSLAMTQTNFSNFQSPSKVGSGNAAIMNNKVHYPQEIAKKSTYDTIAAAGLDTPVKAFTEKKAYLRHLNNESQLLMMNPMSPSAAGTKTQISRYGSITGANQSPRIEPMVQTTNEWASSNKTMIMNKTLMSIHHHNQGNTGRTSNLAMISPLQIKTGGKPSFGGGDRNLSERQALFATVRKSLNLPGITDGKGKGRGSSIGANKD